MSENKNVTPIRPEQDPEPQGEMTSRSDVKKKLGILAGIIFLGILLTLLFFWDSAGFSSMRQAESQIGADGTSAPVEFRFDDGANNRYAAFGSAMAAVTETGLTVFDATGEVVGSAQYRFATPLLRSGDRLVMACDVGGNRLTAMDETGAIALNLSTEGTLLDADLSSGDAICFAELGEAEKTVLTVYDKSQNQIFQFYSASRYMNQCAVSSDGSYLCAAALGQKNGAFESSAVIFSTDQEEPLTEVSLGNQMILEMRYLGNETFCALGENSILYFHIDGTVAGQFQYEGGYLEEYAMDDSGFTVLALKPYQAGNQYSVVALNREGEKTAEMEIGEEILSLSVSNGQFAILTPSSLSLYDSTLTCYASTEELQTASAAVILEDGSAILLGGGVGTFYDPG